MLEYDPNDYTKRTIVQRKCLRLTNIPFTEELAKCFKVQQQQEQRYCLNETKKACNTTKCAQDRNRQQSPVQMQPIEQMKQSQLQQQLQPFKRQKSEQKTSPLAYSGISPNFFHFSSTKQPLPLQQQPQEQLQQLELVKHEQKQQQENPLSYNQNHLNVIQNLDELIANSKKNAPSRSMSAPPLPPPPLPESAPPQPPPSYNENTVRKCCCGGGGGGDGDVEDGDVENGDDCHKIPRFKMSGQFFDSLKKIEKNFCLTEDELCNVQENLWKLSQNSKTPIINHNIEYMLEKKLLNDHTVTFLQSILCAMVSQSKLSRHFVRQFLHALRSAVDLVNNYFHPWALLSTNDPYELAQLNGVLSMNLKEIYESPNKWLYIKNFLVMLCRNKSTEGIVDYFLKRISKEVLFPDAIDILEKIINEKSLNLSNAELCNLQNALNECTKRLFRADPILNKEYALKATKAPAVKDFDTAYRFTKVLSILSLKQINNYLHLDDIKKIVTGEKLKKIFDYVNMSVHDLNINRLSNIIEIAKEADTHRYKLNNKDLKIAITNLHSSDEQRKLQGLHDLTKYFCDMPSPYLENMLNDLRKYKLLACQQFNDIYKYMEKDRGINKDQKTLANIQRVKIALKDILQACQPLKDSNINEKTTNELADILQTVHPQDAANFVKDLDFSQLDTPEDYRKLILKLSYMQPNDLKVFSENLKTKKILPNSKIVTLQNLIDNDQKALRLTGTKAKELKKLLQNFIVKRYSRKVKRVAYTDDVTEIKDTTKKLFPEQDNEQLLKNLHETAQASTIKKMEVEKETEVEKKAIKSRKKRSRPGKRFRVKDSVEEGIVPQESDKKKHNQMQIHDKKKEKISTGKKPEKKEHEILGDSKVFKENDMNILEHDEHKKKVSKIAHLKFTDLPTNEQRDSQTPMYRDRKSRLSILFYRDMHSLKTPRELKEKPERLTQEELDAVESFDTLDKRKQQRGLSYLERASSFTEDHNRETIAWPLYEDNLSITNDTKYLDGLKKESRGLGIASFNTTFKFPDKGHEGRRQFIQKRSAHSLFKDLPYLKAVIQMRKSLTRLNRKLPKSTLVPKRLNQKLSLSVSQSESEIDPAPSLAIFPSTSLPILPSTYSEKFSPPNGKQVRKYASDMSISPSVQQLSRKLPLVTSIFKLPFQSEDDYLALISKLSYLDKRSSRAYIMDLYRKGVLNEAKLRRLQDVLRDNEFDTLPKAIRNSITKTVDDLLEDETFNLLLSELKIEYLAPIYFENYAEYKFRQPTPQCHPKIDINYNRGLANFIKLVRRTIINFRQAEVTDINKAVNGIK